MAKIKLNPIFEQAHGSVGDLVLKQYGDDLVISRKGDPNSGEATPAQLAARARFRQAVLYGRQVMADPQVKAQYVKVAKAKGQRLFSLVVADFFNAPTVDDVELDGYTGQVGDEIIVLAHDDFIVSSVHVEVSDASQAVIESGAASEFPAGSGRWVYAATVNVAASTQVTVRVVATDRPGGVATATAMKTL